MEDGYIDDYTEVPLFDWLLNAAGASLLPLRRGAPLLGLQNQAPTTSITSREKAVRIRLACLAQANSVIQPHCTLSEENTVAGNDAQS